MSDNMSRSVESLDIYDELWQLDMLISNPQACNQEEASCSPNSEQRGNGTPPAASPQQAAQANARGSTRRRRTVFTPEMVAVLENFFWGNRYPNACERDSLANLISHEEHRIQIWFQNRRAKAKKAEAAAARLAEQQRIRFGGNVPGANVYPGAMQNPVQMNHGYGGYMYLPIPHN